VAFTLLILWTVLACMFAITLGYSRIPYAAARNGDFFRAFATLHAVHRYPVVSLWALAGLTVVFCYFPLAYVIDGAVTVRIVVQFIGQIVALHLLRTTRPDVPLPFRMWLYPIPSLLALCGWLFVLFEAEPVILAVAAAVLASGCVAYLVWRGTLPCAAALYWFGICVRNAAFDLHCLRSQRVPLPVVSIGNLTTGGTGKTPFAAHVARWFQNRGVRVCFVSRGYGAARGTTNDEARVLAQLRPDVPHVQDPDRVAAARRALDEHSAQLLILDDAFQHRWIARDLDIVLVDAMNPWGYGFLLPRGLLREPLSALRRASIAVITRADEVSLADLAAIRQQITAVAPALEIAEAAFPPERLVNSSGQTASIESLRDQTVVAFCGIGNPQAFHDSLTRLGMRVADFRAYPDHHLYSPPEICELQYWAEVKGAVAVITTQKDLVKIPHNHLGNSPLWAVQIGTRITNHADLFEKHLQSVLDRVERRK
jgi:tetraacyldisaccharide 4'-kinase